MKPVLLCSGWTGPFRLDSGICYNIRQANYKELAMSRKNRVYSLEFKQDIVRQILEGAEMSTLSREHGIHRNCLAYWVKKHHEGRLGNTPSTEKALERKVQELEQVIGQLTVENRLLKKFLNTAQAQPKRSASSLLTTYPSSEACKGGAKC